MTDTKQKTMPVKHIGVLHALCSRNLLANLRDDLGSARYRRLGIKERYVGERPYRICKRCIAVIVGLER